MMMTHRTFSSLDEHPLFRQRCESTVDLSTNFNKEKQERKSPSIVNNTNNNNNITSGGKLKSANSMESLKKQLNKTMSTTATTTKIAPVVNSVDQNLGSTTLMSALKQQNSNANQRKFSSQPSGSLNDLLNDLPPIDMKKKPTINSNADGYYQIDDTYGSCNENTDSGHSFEEKSTSDTEQQMMINAASTSTDRYLEPVASSNNRGKISTAAYIVPSFPLPNQTNEPAITKTDLMNAIEKEFKDEFTYAVPGAKIASYLNDELFNQNRTFNEKRYEILRDLVEKENDYLVLLNIVDEEYLSDKKIQEQIQLLPDNERSRLFESYRGILELHFGRNQQSSNINSSSLPTELNIRLKKWNQMENGLVCDIFVNYLRRIRVYDDYIANFAELTKFIDLSAEAESFKKELNRIDLKVAEKYGAKLAKLKINSPKTISFKTFMAYLLVWPEFTNQCLIGYENFITFDNPDSKNYSQCIDYFNELATKAVETLEDSIHAEKLKNLQSRIGHKHIIVERKRVIVKEGPMITINPMFKKIIRMYIVLLNDLLIICDKADNEYESLKAKTPIDVIGMEVSENVDEFTPTKRTVIPKKLEALISVENGLSVHMRSIGKVFKLFSRNIQEKNRWLVSFKKVSEANRFVVDIDRSQIGAKMPKWIPDQLCQYCMKCKSEFNTFNRRHHCRACGQIFCHHCSKMQINLRYDNNNNNNTIDNEKKTTMSRVCDYCYDALMGTFRARPPSLSKLNF